MQLRNPRDFWAGILFAAIGFAFVIVVKAAEYPMGTASRMGAGYFPFVLGLILGVLGLIIVAKALISDGLPVAKFAWRPLFWILGAVIIFGLTAKILGLALVIVVLVLVASFGGHEFKFKEQLVAGVVLSVFSIGVFVYGLKLPFPIWPAFLNY